MKTPPLTAAARVEAGLLLRRLQDGELIGMPSSRPLAAIKRCRRRLRAYDAAGGGAS